MPVEIVVPRLGWSMEEGVFGEWLKSPGDAVRAGEMLFVLEGEKAAQEIESFEAGKLWLAPDAPRKGDTVKVGQRIGFLLAAGEVPPATIPKPAPVTPAKSVALLANSQSFPVPNAGPAARRRARDKGQAQVVTHDSSQRILLGSLQLRAPTAADARLSTAIASPRARRKANEIGLDWQQAAGTGRNGRIRERDIIALAVNSPQRVASENPPTTAGRYEPTSKIRQITAQRMSAGVHEAAPVTLTTKVDATALVNFRDQLKAIANNEPAPSYNDILIKLIAASLPSCPRLNACWHRDSVFLYSQINIAFAVDTDAGLLAPVIENVPDRTLREITQRSRALIEKARIGSLTQKELQGGTFTVTNLGMFDIDAFTPIISLPQSAILGIGRIAREPVVRGDQVMAGETVTFSLTFDHRVLDGAPAAAWLQRLGRSVQSPESTLGK